MYTFPLVTLGCERNSAKINLISLNGKFLFQNKNVEKYMKLGVRAAHEDISLNINPSGTSW